MKGNSPQGTRKTTIHQDYLCSVFQWSFSRNLPAFYYKWRFLFDYATLLTIYAVEDSVWPWSVQLFSKRRPLICIFKESVKRVYKLSFKQLQCTCSRFIQKQLDYLLSISTHDVWLGSPPSCDHFGRHGEWKKFLATKILVKVANWRPTD